LIVLRSIDMPVARRSEQIYWWIMQRIGEHVRTGLNGFERVHSIQAAAER
jgi:hypothetical protein